MSQSTRRQSIGLVTRRRLLQVGAIGALCDLPSLLWASSPSGNGTTSSDPEKSCIFIFQQGGLSQLDSWDLKPDAPDSIRGPYRPIATSVTGFRVGELMPRLARLAHRYCVIRSMRHSEHVHDTAIGMSLTGKSRPPANWPYYGSVLSKLRPSRPGMQSFVCLIPVVGDQRTYHSPGFLGSAHTPLVVGTIADNPATPGFRMTAFDPPEGSTIERSGERRRLLQALESAALSRTPPSPPAAVVHGGAHASAQLDQFRQRAFDLTTSSAARRAFDLDRESPRVRDRYGRHPLGQNLLLARRLIEAGVRLVRVNAFTGLTPGAPPTFPQVWDMHGGSFGSIFGTGAWGLGYALPRADQAVAALRDDRVRTANRVARWRCRAGAAPVPRGSVSGAQGWEAAGVGEAVAGVVPAGAALGSAACQRSGSSSSR
ncbi:MAG: DUF1501 domain-containing protein, partial [Planctomycetes bacterium]|nr:DUF1501 domain-containing protein [Planctomycetota bacterium]